VGTLVVSSGGGLIVVLGGVSSKGEVTTDVERWYYVPPLVPAALETI
jgi:hypothetical protein